MNALLERYKSAVDHWPKAVDEKAVEVALLAHAKAVGQTQTKVVHALAALDALDARAARAALAALDARAALYYWGWDASYYAAYAVGAREINKVSVEAQYEPLITALENGLWFFYFTETEIVWYSQPVIKKDVQNRPHSERGPAFEFLGLREYFWHGVFIADHRVVDSPTTLTAAEIEAEQNAEVRRIMIERFGQAKFLLESGAKQIHKDDFGTLFSKNIQGDEPLVMVKVVNATPEHDGSFKDYFLRVDPQLRPLFTGNKKGKPQAMTAHNAVASTFGMCGEEYDPVLQT